MESNNIKIEDANKSLNEKVILYEKEIRNLKGENILNKNKINTQQKLISELKEKINKNEENKLNQKNNNEISSKKEEENNEKNKYKEKDKEISRLKNKVNKLIINLSQKDQNILILNDEVVELEDKLNEVNKENDNFKQILNKNNIKF